MSVRDIEAFHKDYLAIGGAPPQKPYLQPFRSRGTEVGLLNKNVQGSYAPSSIRTDQPLSRVVQVEPTSEGVLIRKNPRYWLVEDHANKVLSEMLAGNKILATSLAIFLFRDRTLALPNGSIADLAPALREFFDLGPKTSDGDTTYETLFEDDAKEYSDNDLEQIDAEDYSDNDLE